MTIHILLAYFSILTYFPSRRHWDKLLDPLHGGEIINQPDGYGWENARDLDKSLTNFNADSYGWYATENFWAIICHKENTGYDPPDDE